VAEFDHWCRAVMNEAMEDLVQALNPGQPDALEISGTSWEATGFRSCEAVEWPEFDVCSTIHSRNLDLTIGEEVFEHIRNPLQSARTVRRTLRAGGTFPARGGRV
jgi:hypothetical protein